jgi:outer membrane lipoprotein-sorting protein
MSRRWTGEIDLGHETSLGFQFMGGGGIRNWNFPNRIRIVIARNVLMNGEFVWIKRANTTVSFKIQDVTAGNNTHAKHKTIMLYIL